METALIGLLGALLGVILTEEARRRREARAAKAHTRAAARMVYAELETAAVTAEAGTGRGLWVLGSVPTVGWATHGAELAAALGDDDFAVVMDATSKVAVHKATRDMLPNDVPVQRALMSGGEGEGTDALMKDMQRVCRKAQTVLKPLAYPDQWAADRR